MAGKDKAHDLISRHKLLCSLKRQESAIIDGRAYLSQDAVLEKVRIAPGVAAGSGVHAEWDTTRHGELVCAGEHGCYQAIRWIARIGREYCDGGKPQFCPHCGAEMGGGAT